MKLLKFSHHISKYYTARDVPNAPAISREKVLVKNRITRESRTGTVIVKRAPQIRGRTKITAITTK